MLFLPRLINESILIGNDIEVKVMLIDKEKVCLGISAPRAIEIHRKEVIHKDKNRKPFEKILEVYKHGK